MHRDPGLQKLLGEIVPALSPVAVYLFGSRSRGEERIDSDYDLLVVVPDDFPRDRLSPTETYKLARRARIAADIVACRRSGFEDAKDVVGTLSYEAFHNGVLVHGDA